AGGRRRLVALHRDALRPGRQPAPPVRQPHAGRAQRDPRPRSLAVRLGHPPVAAELKLKSQPGMNDAVAEPGATEGKVSPTLVSGARSEARVPDDVRQLVEHVRELLFPRAEMLLVAPPASQPFAVDRPAYLLRARRLHRARGLVEPHAGFLERQPAVGEDPAHLPLE